MSGEVKMGQQALRFGMSAKGEAFKQKFQVTKLLTYQGLKQIEVQSIRAGDIGLVAGSEDYEIGDTIGEEGTTPLERIKVEEPTMRMIFSINTTPNSGRDGKAIQSRELRERLMREVRNNVALRLQDSDTSDQYYLLGRGELQFGIIIEKFRREGLEFMVGRPTVLLKNDENGKRLEPYERLILDLPEQYSGDVTKLFQMRKGVLTSYENADASSSEPRVRLVFEIPTRGLLGTNSLFKTATRGTGIMSSEALGYREFQGDLAHRSVGSLVSDRSGSTTAYALATLQERGQLFIGEGEDVYEGMIIGECAKDNDLNVNPCRPKKLTNMRSTSSDGLTILQGTRKMPLERCIEWIDDDEWIEITPKKIRLRKKILAGNLRSVRREERV
jgi:GTP-binding protein